MSDAERERLEQVLNAPDNRDAIREYAGWLVDREDQRGELMLIQLSLEDEALDETERGQLKERESALLSRCAPAWMGEIAKHRDVTIEFTRGLPRRVRLEATHLLAKLLEVPARDAIEVIECRGSENLAPLSELRYLAALRVVGVTKRRPLTQLRETAISELDLSAAVVRARWIDLLQCLVNMPRLRTLRLGRVHGEDATADLAGQVGPFPALEHLDLTRASGRGNWTSLLRCLDGTPVETVDLGRLGYLSAIGDETAIPRAELERLEQHPTLRHLNTTSFEAQGLEVARDIVHDRLRDCLGFGEARVADDRLEVLFYLDDSESMEDPDDDDDDDDDDDAGEGRANDGGESRANEALQELLTSHPELSSLVDLRFDFIEPGDYYPQCQRPGPPCVCGKSPSRPGDAPPIAMSATPSPLPDLPRGVRGKFKKNDSIIHQGEDRLLVARRQRKGNVNTGTRYSLVFLNDGDPRVTESAAPAKYSNVLRPDGRAVLVERREGQLSWCVKRSLLIEHDLATGETLEWPYPQTERFIRAAYIDLDRLIVVEDADNGVKIRILPRSGDMGVEQQTLMEMQYGASVWSVSAAGNLIFVTYDNDPEPTRDWDPYNPPEPSGTAVFRVEADRIECLGSFATCCPTKLTMYQGRLYATRSSEWFAISQ